MRTGLLLQWVTKMGNSADVKIRYEGQTHQVDLDMLLVSLLHWADMVRAVADEVQPDSTIQISISAPEKGSFKVDLALVQKMTGLLKDAVPKLPETLKSMVDVLTIKRMLKGEKPTKVEPAAQNVSISINQMQIVVPPETWRAYKNPRVNEAMSKMFVGLTGGTEIEGLQVDAGAHGVFEAKANEFSDMARANELIEEDKTTVIKKAEVSVVKVVFQRDRVWEFVYDGIRISALISDKDFWERVDSSNARFGKGDRFVVDLEITKVFDPEVQSEVNRSYRILKVIDHRPASRADQQQLPE